MMWSIRQIISKKKAEGSATVEIHGEETSSQKVTAFGKNIGDDSLDDAVAGPSTQPDIPITRKTNIRSICAFRSLKALEILSPISSHDEISEICSSPNPEPSSTEKSMESYLGSKGGCSDKKYFDLAEEGRPEEIQFKGSLETDCRFLLNKILQQVEDHMFGDSIWKTSIDKSRSDDGSTDSIPDELICDAIEDLVNLIIQKASIINKYYRQSKILREKASKDVVLFKHKLEFKEKEFDNLRSELNALEERESSLEYELLEKENTIAENDAKLSEQHQQIKELSKTTLEENVIEIENVRLRLKIKKLLEKKSSLQQELKKVQGKERHYRKVLKWYESSLDDRLTEFCNLQDQHDIITHRLTDLRESFVNIHQKYKNAKRVINGFKSNELALKKTVAALEENLTKAEKKYEAMKRYAYQQLEKYNNEVKLIRKKYDVEQKKLHTAPKQPLEKAKTSLQFKK